MSDLDHTTRLTNPLNSKPYALSGQIMLSAIVILFFVVVLMVALHLYARWYLLRARRRQLLRRRSRLNHARRTHQQILFYVDNISGTLISSDPANRGLEQAVLNSLPEFVYSSKTHHPKVTDCAVCLSEFEENETGRILPKCNHSFHIECIDMWFLSHSTCPLCRAPVEKFSDSGESNSEVVINLGDPDPNTSVPGCSSGSGDGDTGTSSFGERRKGMEFAGVRIDIPIRSELEDEIGLSSPGASQSFRSPPGTRLLSLKRILSIGKKTPTTPQTTTSCGVSAVAGTSCSGGTLASEIDELDRGTTELTQGLR